MVEKEFETEEEDENVFDEEVYEEEEEKVLKDLENIKLPPSNKIKEINKKIIAKEKELGILKEKRNLQKLKELTKLSDNRLKKLEVIKNG